MRRSCRRWPAWFVPIFLVGCGVEPPDGLPIPDDARTVIREGLPHPVMEPAVYRAEADGPKPRIEVGGYPLYEAPLAIEGRDRREILALLNDPATYRAFSGEKKCGGFHPDYAVEWSSGGVTRNLLICFGCVELEQVGPAGSRRFDLDGANRTRLRPLLYNHRTNRPEPGDRE